MHTSFILVKKQGGSDDTPQVFTGTPAIPGETLSHQTVPGTPVTQFKCIAGPFSLPVPFPHAAAIERWIDIFQPPALTPFFDEPLTTPVETNDLGQHRCPNCNDRYTPLENDDDAPTWTVRNHHHRTGLCSKHCISEYAIPHENINYRPLVVFSQTFPATSTPASGSVSHS